MIYDKKLLNEEIYKLSLEDFKSIPFIEFESNDKTLEWLCYYEMNEILQYCIEHSKYKKIINENSLINKYCISISLEKSNNHFINYLLKKELINKENIFESIDEFLMGNNPIDYLPTMNKERITLLGNKSIYHVKEKFLKHALNNGFDLTNIEINNFLFCIINNVNLKEKEEVLKLIENLESNYFTNNITDLINNKEIFNLQNQCMDKVIEIIFKNINIKKLCEENTLKILKIIEIEKKFDAIYFKNKVLLDYSNDFSQEDLQKIKKFNKDFYREIEKIKLYENLLNSEKESLSKLLAKKIKI